MDLGAPEIILIMIVMFFFFGAKKIPDIMKGLGTGLREFRKAARGVQDEMGREIEQAEKSDESSNATHLPAASAKDKQNESQS